jgi:Concanavalin A-like lectin/glucanases superfamily
MVARSLGFHARKGSAGPSIVNSILLMHFDGTNGSSTMTDVYGNTCTSHGDAFLSNTIVKFGPTGLGLPAANLSYVNISHTSSFDFGSADLTIELWVQMNSTDTTFNRGIVCRRTNYSSGQTFGPYLIFQPPNSTKINWLASFEGTAWDVNLTGGISLGTGSLHHFAAVRHNNVFTTYVDGVQDQTVSASGSLYADGQATLIGRDAPDSPNYFDGGCDELRISPVARYTAAFTPPSAAFTY